MITSNYHARKRAYKNRQLHYLCNYWRKIKKIVLVKYFSDDLERIQKIEAGDWVDLRSAETVEMKAGEFRMIPLGIAVQLPPGYEAHIAPRSSTFKNFGIIQVNSPGVVDNSYRGDNDQWHFPAYALRDTTIRKNDRICQFRVVERQPDLEIVTVSHLENKDRGGLGSTGVN